MRATSPVRPATRPQSAARTKNKGRLLVVDDDRIILESLSELLQLEGYEVESAVSFAAALQAMERNPAQVVITDANMPGGNGFELLHVMRKRYPESVVLMMTAYGTIESAVEAIKMGAYDYLTKPIIDDELKVCVERALAQQALLRENRMLKERLDARFGLESLIGHDYRMAKVFDVIQAVAATKVTVLVLGPSGTGKSLAARVIHQLSDRRDKPFVEVSCGAIPETLLESELFGHVRGAFTGAIGNRPGKFRAADGGTIFLDEISTASPALQVKLLRFLQSQQFEPVGSTRTETIDARVVLATNLDLEQEVKAGRFREDLYYRINVVSVDMPPLRDRVGDIPALADHFLRKYAAEMGRDLRGFDEGAIAVLARYPWPGNVRELENVVERAVVLCTGPRITSADLPPKLLSHVPGASEGSPVVWEPKPLKEALEAAEREVISAALRANGWNRQSTSRQLGINRTTLYKKMRQFGLDGEPE